MTRAKSRPLDLDPDSREALEFDELLGWISGGTRTNAGSERVLATRPDTDAERVRLELEGVEQTRLHLAELGRLLSERLPDPSALVGALGVAGLALGAEALRDGARTLAAASALGRSLRGLDPKRYAQLVTLGREMPDLGAECRVVLDGTDDQGRILDGASSELRRIRRGMLRVSEQLRSMLQRSMRQPGAESVVRDDFITERNGRFVIPVRTDAPWAIRGIVHASSSSGATRFVEPLESVELNNEMVRLGEEERAEQERILSRWSEGFRLRQTEVELAVGRLGRADELQARALFAEQIRAVAPRVVEGGPLRLEAVRHPLLDRRLAQQDAQCVPADLALDPADRVLVISGPNTGGKTVVLKTLGLAVLMAQSGIPVPALQAELPLFRQVRADIGDHQSIQSDLSTYSAHVGAIVGFIEERTAPALYLFDELGTGTEPAEGAALAQAILEELARPGITAVATTHHGSLKQWAVTSDAAVCAAMEFDEESLAPTYRIRIGTAGVSAGLQIAERLGMPARVVERARAGLDPLARRSEEYLSRLHAALTEAESAREDLRQRQTALDGRRLQFEDGLERETERHRRRLDEEIDQSLEQFRRAARRELEALGRDGARVERSLRRAEQRLGGEKARLRAAKDDDAGLHGPAGWVAPESLDPGTTVHVASLGRQGIVGQVLGEQVEVRLGRLSLRVPRSELSVEPEAQARTPRTEIGGAAIQPTSGGAAAGVSEVMLVGRRVEEGLALLERFLDRAQITDQTELRVVHGHGTGRLRAAVRRFLDRHPLVARHRPGGAGEGGDGATVVTLR